LEVPNIAKSFFSEKQIASLKDTATHQREEVFLRLWIQLEARGKATGTGIVSPNCGGLNRRLSWQMLQLHQDGSDSRVCGVSGRP
jgi:phosphopantetheinyl transferase